MGFFSCVKYLATTGLLGFIVGRPRLGEPLDKIEKSRLRRPENTQMCKQVEKLCLQGLHKYHLPSILHIPNNSLSKQSIIDSILL